MIFVDTSAFYALADRADLHNLRAREVFTRVLEERTPLLTHNYVLVESFALLQRRLGLPAARALQQSARSFEVVWVDQELHADAATRWAGGGRSLSFVDHVSFLLMQRLRIETAFAFDSNFERAGFRLVE